MERVTKAVDKTVLEAQLEIIEEIMDIINDHYDTICINPESIRFFNNIELEVACIKQELSDKLNEKKKKNKTKKTKKSKRAKTESCV